MNVMEIVKALSDNGILIIIAAVFIWNTITVQKELQKNIQSQSSILESLKTTCENTATALNIIQNTIASSVAALDNNTEILKRHDQRSEYMNGDIRVIKTVLESRPCAKEMEEQQ